MGYYTPFMTQGGAAIGGAIRDRRQRGREEELNQVASKAYMGDPEAIQNLMKLNPEMGLKVQQAAAERKKNKEQDHLASMTGIQKDIKGMNEEIAAFPDFESSRQFGEQQMEILKQKYPPEFLAKFGDLVYDEKDFKQAKTIYSDTSDDPVQRSVDIPGQGTKLVRKSGKVDFKPASIESSQAFIRSQEQEIKQATTKAGKVEASKLAAKSREGLKSKVNESAFAAREQKPRLDNLEKLATMASTGTLGQQRMELKRAFGVDVATEEEFLAETNRVILDAADSLKGALSDRENEYLEAVGPGVGKSKEGNLAIIRNLQAIADNAINRQEALKKFKGDPVDFNYQGAPLNGIKAQPSGPQEGQIYINPKTGDKGTIKDGKWKTL